MRLINLLPLVALPVVNAQLNTLAKAKGLKYFGSATDNGELTDAPYLAILSNTSEFGQITAGNAQKWMYIEPSQNTFSYAQGDVIASLAATNGQLLRCHTLVWHSQLPTWVTSGTWTNATLIVVMQNHIKNEVTHYAGKCYAWDVVNEAFNEDGTYRSSVFYNTIGPEFIPIAFATAALYDPTAKLYYNDYNIEYAGAHSTAAVNLVSSLKARGIKIDGVGLQGHFIVGGTPSLSTLKATLNSFVATGVEVAYTEVDVRFTTLPPAASGSSSLAQQSIDYVNVVNSCLQVVGCIGITIWDFTDKYSWIPSTFSGQGQACLWYDDLTHHPAYDAVVSALGGGSTSTSTVILSTSTKSSSSTSATTLETSTKSSSSAIVSISSTKSTILSPTSTTTSVISTSTGVLASHWGQCGGYPGVWFGATGCVSPWTCTVFSPYYSQCL